MRSSVALVLLVLSHDSGAVMLRRAPARSTVTRGGSIAASAMAATAPAWTVRTMRRSDILPIAKLLQDSFAGEGRTFLSPKPRSQLDVAVTTVRLALDIERRCTTWDWARHSQLVAESAEGSLLGFVEVWGEDQDSVGNLSAITPQPCLFNLCVAPGARRLGVARALIEQCEQKCLDWGEQELFLKVRVRARVLSHTHTLPRVLYCVACRARRALLRNHPGLNASFAHAGATRQRGCRHSLPHGRLCGVRDAAHVGRHA